MELAFFIRYDLGWRGISRRDRYRHVAFDDAVFNNRLQQHLLRSAMKSLEYNVRLIVEALSLYDWSGHSV